MRPEILGTALARRTVDAARSEHPEFRPANVRTLHDITRFCLTRRRLPRCSPFGSENNFPRYAAKQLHHNVPMQWWVLNLDDGSTEDIKGQYVHLDEISCGPMHALWNLEWSPFRGTDPAMTVSIRLGPLRGDQEPRSRHPLQKTLRAAQLLHGFAKIMNLQSRFGFHFSTVEALAGERDDENYLVFVKGGAADMNRREARAQFIADILADKGFGMKVIEDTVTARASALPQEMVLDLVRVVVICSCTRGSSI